MIDQYLQNLTILLLTIKRDIEKDSITANNAALTQITICENQAMSLNKELHTVYADLYDKAKHYFADKQSEIRQSYLQGAFNNVRGLLMRSLRNVWYVRPC